jgi:hypothetical protein
MFAILWPFLIYWLVMFVLSYIAVEVGQDQLYDEATPRAGLKVAAGSFILAAMLTYFRPTFDTMFTAGIAWTVLQALVWCGVFIFIYQFHPWHALAIALPLMLITSGFATMGVESVLTPSRPQRPRSSLAAPKAVRKSLTPTATAPTPKAGPPAAR